MSSSAIETSYIQLLDSNGNAVEAQTAYDAAMSGPIYATKLSTNASTYAVSTSNITQEEYYPLIFIGVLKNSGTIVSAMFACPTFNGKYFYAGTDPSTLG